MKRVLFIPFYIICLTAFSQKYINNELIFKVKDDYRNFCTENSINVDLFNQTIEKWDVLSLNRMFPQLPISDKRKLKSDISLLYKLKFNTPINPKIIIDILNNLKLFEYVEPVFEHQLLYTPNDPASDSTLTTQDYLKMHKAYQAWDITKGDSNILVAVSDNGVNLNHVDLQNTLHKNYADTVDGIDNDNDGLIDNFIGYDLSDKDNDVTESGLHGTFVVGCVSADNDNGKGIAGIGFNTKVVPLKVYGNSFTGYESIVFAANKGYDVINLSWGCIDCFSHANQDIINYAVLDKNLVVVAAAGNTEAEVFWYPASFENVLSVSGLKSNFTKGSSLSWNYNVDVMAKGNTVYSTSTNGGYGNVSGTSFAAPMAAGAAALVKSVFPNYNAQQIMEQIRVTADTIYQIGTNYTYQDKLGKGSLNVFRAVSDSLTPSIRNLTNYAETQPIYLNNDTILLSGEFKNFLNPTKNLKIKISSPSNFIQLIDSEITVGVIPMLGSFENSSNAFSFKIINNPPLNSKIWLKFSYSDTNYIDFEYKFIYLNQDFITIRENKLALSINSTGNIGYNIPNRSQGIGFSYNNGAHIMYESGLILTSDTSKMSNNLRLDQVSFAQKFFKRNLIQEVSGGSFSDFKATSQFFDTTVVGNNYVGVNVTQNVYAWNSAPDDKYIIVEYEITNRTADTIGNLFAGIFADWDLNSHGLDRANWNHNQGFGYVYDTQTNTTFAGIKPLLPYYGTYYAIENNATSPTSLEINNDFTNREKYKTVSSYGTEKITAGENYNTGAGDVSHVVGNQLGKFLPNEKKTVAFAIMAGDSIEDLEQSAYYAQQKYGSPISLLSPKPNTKDTTICVGSTALINATGGSNYAIFLSENDFLVMDTILPFEASPIYDTTSYYISFRDSLALPSQKSELIVNTYRPEVEISFKPDTLYLLDETEVQLLNVSPSFSIWEWNYFDTIYNSTYNPKISFSKEGNYPVSLSIIDANNCPNSKTDSIIVLNAKRPNGLVEKEFLYKVYPNPSSEKLMIELGKIEFSIVEIYNALGQKIISIELTKKHNVIDVSTLENGLYLLKINNTVVNFIKK